MKCKSIIAVWLANCYFLSHRACNIVLHSVRRFGEEKAFFFYTWTQLTCSPVEWFKARYVIQRTRAYQTPLDLQRGLLIGFTHRNVTFTTNIFDPGQAWLSVVLSLGYSF
jgi:hypothetical protein